MACGKVPEYGAIFMSNRTTSDECFQRNLVGLPLTHADFVKEIRAGMVLFIFEYEQRKLYGVLKAVTDGKINIKPNAYRSSGKLFPAQVRFEEIWRCRPLHEDEFQAAIKDNYFAAHRFNFGLSKNQVQDLLHLFLSKNPRVERAIRESTIKKQTPLDDVAEISWNRWVPSEEKPEENTGLASPSIWSLDFIPLSSSPGNDNNDLEETTEEEGDQTSSAIIPQFGEIGRPKVVKGLYSDSSPGERGSVFSRLVAAASKPAVEEKVKKTKSVPSVREIMENLETLHGRWRKRTSVFSRLKFGSKDSREDTKEVTGTDNKSTTRGRERFQMNTRKRCRGVSIRSQVQVNGDRYPNKRHAERQQKEESLLVTNVNNKENLLETDCKSENIVGSRWPSWSRDRLAPQTTTTTSVQVPFSSGKENVQRSLEGSNGSNRTDDDYQEIVPALILPPPAKVEDNGGAAEGNGGSTTTNVGVSTRTFLKTYQRRRRVSTTSPSSGQGT